MKKGIRELNQLIHELEMITIRIRSIYFTEKKFKDANLNHEVKSIAERAGNLFDLLLGSNNESSRRIRSRFEEGFFKNEIKQKDVSFLKGEIQKGKNTYELSNVNRNEIQKEGNLVNNSENLKESPVSWLPFYIITIFSTFLFVKSSIPVQYLFFIIISTVLLTITGVMRESDKLGEDSLMKIIMKILNGMPGIGKFFR